MKSARLTDESTQCQKRNTELMKVAVVVTNVAVAVVTGLSLLKDIFDQDEADQYVSDESSLQGTEGYRRPSETGEESGDIRPDGRRVQISWGTDASGRDECPQNAVCQNYDYELSGFGSAPYTLECWERDNGGEWLRTYNEPWSGTPERGCYSWVSDQTVYVVVDGVKSNELLWTQPDDEEVQLDGREVRISWGADLNRDPDPDIRRECRDFVFCQAFSYELIGDFGSAPYTLECYVSHQRWEPYPLRGREGCRARGKNLIDAYVIVDGVKSNELHWSRSG